MSKKIQLFIAMIIFPLVYVLFSITPMAKELFVNNNTDYYYSFWSIIIALHLCTFFIVLRFLKNKNQTLRDIGYTLSQKKTIVLIGSYFVMAFLVYGFTEYSLKELTIDEDKLNAMSPFFPRDSFQRLLFIFSVLCAAFCEEIIYRGFIITRLREIGVNKWLALVPAGVSFVFIHGIIGFSQFTFYFIPAIIFGVIYILSKRLLPSIIIHLLFNLSAMMAVFSAIG